MANTFQRPDPPTVATDSKYDPLLQSIEAMVFTLSVRGTILDCNGTCVEQTGFSIAQLVNRNLADTVALPGEADALQAKIDQIISGELVDRFETCVQTKHGDQKRIRWSGIGLETVEQTLPAILLTGIDLTNEFVVGNHLTRSRETSAKLKQQLARLNATYDLGDAAVDRRSERRPDYRQRQRVAPFDGRHLPTNDCFIEVECRNIGARGISFFLDNPPATRDYVIKLSRGPTVINLSAEIRHATLTDLPDSRRFLIGSQFTGRITEGANG